MSPIDTKGAMIMRTWLGGALMSASIAMTGAAALAQDYPARQIQGVIQWGAGGSTDNVSRAITPLVEPHLGQKVVLTNRPGATGVIATQYVSARPADGYTILYGAENPQLYGVLGLSDLSYADFYPVNLLARGVVILVANNDTPWNSFQELVDDVKARPGEIKMGSTGVGGVPFVVGAMIQNVIDGFQVTAVPFEGDGPGLTALQGGHVDFMPAVLGATRELITSGRVKALAVVNTEPLAELEGIAPVTDDYPEFASYLPWGPFFGVFVKEGTPEEATAKLAEAFEAGASDEQFQTLVDNLGLIRMNISGDEARAFLDRWQSVTAWLLQDTGEAKVSPEELGIPRVE
jgi:tripartite-type tricarboxylate transporter receptor subunit TctC